MSSREEIQVDWLTIVLYAILVILGWANIYAASYKIGQEASIFSLDLESGKQLLWIGTAVVIITVLMLLDFKFYDFIAYILYGLFIAMLVGVLLFGVKKGGAQSWFELGGFRLQPSEFAKFATALAVAKYIGNTNGFRFSQFSHLVIVAGIVLLPMGLILLQPDAGTVLVYSSFILVFYREGLHPIVLWILITAIVLFILTLAVENQLTLFYGVGALAAIIMAFIYWRRKTFNRTMLIVFGIAIVVCGYILSVDYLFKNVLQPHQQKRILVTLNLMQDPRGVGYNLDQSKQTIGSGGLWGKGFLEGERTQEGWVPEQSTDFIFTTLAEEHGWIGTTLVIALFVVLILRLMMLADRQKSRFARVYGYGVVSILFFHLMINVGMTIGLFPVVGIPLPFFSYGGSSLWSFTVLVFILIKLDAHRGQVLMR